MKGSHHRLIVYMLWVGTLLAAMLFTLSEGPDTVAQYLFAALLIVLLLLFTVMAYRNNSHGIIQRWLVMALLILTEISLAIPFINGLRSGHYASATILLLFIVVVFRAGLDMYFAPQKRRKHAISRPRNDNHGSETQHTLKQEDQG